MATTAKTGAGVKSAPKITSFDEAAHVFASIVSQNSLYNFLRGGKKANQGLSEQEIYEKALKDIKNYRAASLYTLNRCLKRDAATKRSYFKKAGEHQGTSDGVMYSKAVSAYNARIIAIGFLRDEVEGRQTASEAMKSVPLTKDEEEQPQEASAAPVGQAQESELPQPGEKLEETEPVEATQAVEGEEPVVETQPVEEPEEPVVETEPVEGEEGQPDVEWDSAGAGKKLQDSQLSALEKEIDSQRAGVNELKLRLAEQERNVASARLKLEEDSNQLEDEKAQLAKDIKQFEADKKKQQKELDARSKSINDLEEVFSGREAALEAREKEVEAKSEELKDLSSREAALKRRTAYLDKRETNISSRENEVKEAQALLKEKEEKITGLEEKLKQRETGVYNREQTVKEAEDALGEKDSSLTEVLAKINAAKQEAEEAKASAEAAMDVADSRFNAVAEREKELKLREEALNTREKELDAKSEELQRKLEELELSKQTPAEAGEPAEESEGAAPEEEAVAPVEEPIEKAAEPEEAPGQAPDGGTNVLDRLAGFKDRLNKTMEGLEKGVEEKGVEETPAEEEVEDGFLDDDLEDLEDLGELEDDLEEKAEEQAEGEQKPVEETQPPEQADATGQEQEKEEPEPKQPQKKVVSLPKMQFQLKRSVVQGISDADKLLTEINAAPELKPSEPGHISPTARDSLVNKLSSVKRRLESVSQKLENANKDLVTRMYDELTDAQAGWAEEDELGDIYPALQEIPEAREEFEKAKGDYSYIYTKSAQALKKVNALAVKIEKAKDAGVIPESLAKDRLLAHVSDQKRYLENYMGQLERKSSSALERDASALKDALEGNLDEDELPTVYEAEQAIQQVSEELLECRQAYVPLRNHISKGISDVEYLLSKIAPKEKVTEGVKKRKLLPDKKIKKKEMVYSYEQGISDEAVEKLETARRRLESALSYLNSKGLYELRNEKEAFDESVAGTWSDDEESRIYPELEVIKQVASDFGIRLPTPKPKRPPTKKKKVPGRQSLRDNKPPRVRRPKPAKGK